MSMASHSALQGLSFDDVVDKYPTPVDVPAANSSSAADPSRIEKTSSGCWLCFDSCCDCETAIDCCCVCISLPCILPILPLACAGIAYSGVSACLISICHVTTFCITYPCVEYCSSPEAREKGFLCLWRKKEVPRCCPAAMLSCPVWCPLVYLIPAIVMCLPTALHLFLREDDSGGFCPWNWIACCTYCIEPTRQLLIRQQCFSSDELRVCEISTERDGRLCVETKACFFHRMGLAHFLDVYRDGGINGFCITGCDKAEVPSALGWDLDDQNCSCCHKSSSLCLFVLTQGCRNLCSLSVLCMPCCVPLLCLGTNCFQACCSPLRNYPLHQHMINNVGKAKLFNSETDKALLTEANASASSDAYDLPIHLLCQNLALKKEAQLEDVKLVIKAFPAGLAKKNYEGLYPLQMALQSGRSLEFITLLAEHNSSVVCDSFKYGLDRKYIDPFSRAFTEVDPSLRKGTASTEEQKAYKERKLAFDLGEIKRLETEKAKVLALVMADLPICGNQGNTYLRFLDMDLEDENFVVSVVRTIFEEYPPKFHFNFANCVDERGRTAISIAHAEVRAEMQKYLFFLERYELCDSQPLHRSATAAVFFATDHRPSALTRKDENKSIAGEKQEAIVPQKRPMMQKAVRSLFSACESGDLQRVEEFIAQGFDVDVRNEDDLTALEMARGIDKPPSKRIAVFVNSHESTVSHILDLFNGQVENCDSFMLCTYSLQMLRANIPMTKVTTTNKPALCSLIENSHDGVYGLKDLDLNSWTIQEDSDGALCNVIETMHTTRTNNDWLIVIASFSSFKLIDGGVEAAEVKRQLARTSGLNLVLINLTDFHRDSLDHHYKDKFTDFLKAVPVGAVGKYFVGGDEASLKAAVEAITDAMIVTSIQIAAVKAENMPRIIALLESSTKAVGEASSSASMRSEKRNEGQIANKVAIKFMQEENQFKREIEARLDNGLNDEFVVKLLRFHAQDMNFNGDFKAEAKRFSLSEFPFCIVMDAADKNLKAIIDSERFAGRDFDKVKAIGIELAKAIGHMHDKGFVHGDIKPLNCVRIAGHIKLIDLDASVRFGEYAAEKWSSAYLPPELLFKSTQGGKIGILSRNNELAQQEQLELVEANASQDIWSFGCVLFQLCSGETLWQENDENNIDQDTLRLLFDWTSITKVKKLAKIKDKNARNLVSQLLGKEPSKRPASMAHVLSHPFFTGRVAGRSSGEEAEFDVFISYRWFANDDVVEKIYELLTSKGLKVWWDKKCLLHGVNWEEGFCDGLIKSRCFVPIMSRAAIKSQFESLVENSPCDNVLLEHRLALELMARGLVERIYPLMIGDVDASTLPHPTYNHFFRDKCNPFPLSTAVVASVEGKLLEHLERQTLGAPLHDCLSVKEVFDTLCNKLGGFVEGSDGLDVILGKRADEIVAMVRLLRSSNTLGGGGDDYSGGEAVAAAASNLVEARTWTNLKVDEEEGATA